MVVHKSVLCSAIICDNYCDNYYLRDSLNILTLIKGARSTPVREPAIDKTHHGLSHHLHHQHHRQGRAHCNMVLLFSTCMHVKKREQPLHMTNMLKPMRTLIRQRYQSSDRSDAAEPANCAKVSARVLTPF